jgi:copper chaperone
MTTEFLVRDATCGHCKQTIEGTISAIDGVTAAELDLDSKILRIEHNEADALAEAVSAAGYSPEVSE